MIEHKKLYFPLAIIILSFLLIAGLATHTYTVQKKLYLEGIDKQLKLAADTAELYLGNDFIDRYTKTTPPSKTFYQKHVQKLSTFSQKNNIQYVYMMVQEGDEVYIVFSSATKEEIANRTYDPFYTPYKASDSVMKGFMNQKSFFVSEHDEYGSFRSYCKYGYSPDGKLYMVGADISLNLLQAFIDSSIQYYAYVFGIMALLIILIFYIYLRLFQKNRHLKKIALIDPLTQLYNRQKLDDKLLEEQSKVDSSTSYHCSCLLVDIDHFKSINDNFGHLEGDRVLQEIARVMETFFRSNDILGRWGGEEFLIVLPATKIEDAHALAEKLRDTVETHFQNSIQSVTVSIGVGPLSKESSIRHTLNNIDLALYTAKNNGRNRVELSE